MHEEVNKKGFQVTWSGMSLALAHESLIGPCSELVNVNDFLEEAEAVCDGRGEGSTEDISASSGDSNARAVWDRLDSETKEAVSLECTCILCAACISLLHVSAGSVSDLKSMLDDDWKNPRLATHIVKSHIDFVGSIYGTADKSSKRKRKRGVLPDPTEEHPEITSFQKKLDSTRLQCWPSVPTVPLIPSSIDVYRLTVNSALFMRTPKNSDQNALCEIVSLRFTLLH
jgi:snRNA-activating protein complex subunit 3